jgi:hypothetical protein
VGVATVQRVILFGCTTHVGAVARRERSWIVAVSVGGVPLEDKYVRIPAYGLCSTRKLFRTSFRSEFARFHSFLSLSMTITYRCPSSTVDDSR